MNGMCVLPVAGRSALPGENGDNSNGLSTVIDGAVRLSVRGGIGAGPDEDLAGSGARVRAPSTEARRSQGIRKLQKCLSTTTSGHYECSDTGSGGSNASASTGFPSTSLFYAQRSTEMRNYSATAVAAAAAAAANPQAPSNYQNILTNTRQYSSFGSIAR